MLLLTHGDEVLNAVRYAHRILGVRPNVTVLDQNYMQFEWFVRRARRQPYFAALTFPGAAYGTRHSDGFVMSDLVEANYKTHAIYVCGGVVPADRSWEAAYRLWPLGLAAQASCLPPPPLPPPTSIPNHVTPLALALASLPRAPPPRFPSPCHTAALPCCRLSARCACIGADAAARCGHQVGPVGSQVRQATAATRVARGSAR